MSSPRPSEDETRGEEEENRDSTPQELSINPFHRQIDIVGKKMDAVAKLQKTMEFNKESNELLDRAVDYMQLYLSRYSNGNFNTDWIRRMLFYARIHGTPVSRLRFPDTECLLESKRPIEEMSDNLIEIYTAFKKLPTLKGYPWMDDSLLFLFHLLTFHLVNLQVKRRSEDGSAFLSSYIHGIRLHDNAERHRVIMLLNYCLDVERNLITERSGAKHGPKQNRSQAITFSNFLRTLFDEPKSSVGLLPLAVWGAVQFGSEEELADYMLDACTKHPFLLVQCHYILSRFHLEQISGRLFERLFDLSLECLATSPVLLEILEQRSLDPTGFGMFDSVISQNLKALFMFLDYGRHRTDVRAWALLHTNLCYLCDNNELMWALLWPLWTKRKDWWPHSNSSAGETSTDETYENEESREEGAWEGGGERLHFKRVRHCDTDKALLDHSVDLPKISRYLLAVKNARARALLRLVEQESAENQNLAWVRSIYAEHGERRTELAQWRRVDDGKDEFGESSLSRWIGSQSIELEVCGSVPSDFTGFSTKKVSARKIVDREPKKRGRPRKNPQPEETPPVPPRPRGRPPKVPVTKFEKPITHNERLHSLVDESIAQRSLTKLGTGGGGRCTNNSLNVSLELVQRQNLSPLVSFKIPKKPSSAMPQKNSNEFSLLTLKKPKVEPSDFELPPNFGNIAAVPALSSSSVRPSLRNSFQWAADRPCTSSSVTAHSQRSSDNSESAKNGDSHENITKTRHSTELNANGSMAKSGKEKARNGISKDSDKPTTLQHGDIVEQKKSSSISAKLGIFTAQIFQYEVDVAPAVVKHFESAQVLDIFESLPASIDPRLKQESANGLSLSSARTVNRLVLRQGKRNHRTAQAFFCGGPLSALAVCPRATRRGRELIAIGTFADEKMLRVPTEEKENQHAFVHLWTSNPKDLNDMARLECLLRVPKAQHICSLAWCPLIDEDFDLYRKSLSQKPVANHAEQRTRQTSAPSTSLQNFGEITKESLGLLAVGTHNGRIHIYNIPIDFETLIKKYQGDVCETNSTDSLPLILESEPVITLCHPPTPVFDLNIGNDKTEKAKQRESGRDEAAQAGTDDKLNSKDNVNPSANVTAIPLFCLQWSLFSSARHFGAVSAIGRVFIWDLSRPAEPTWKLHFDDWNSPPQSICWLDREKICISFRRRLFRIYCLISPSESDQFGSSQLVLECDLNKTCGVKCCSQPLIFRGLISYESATFSFFGTSQQAPSYIWVTSSSNESEKDQICATTLSNCHQIQNTNVSVCQLAGLCASVGADGRMACSLNGRMAPNEEGNGENFMHGRTLLQLITHDKSPAREPNDQKRFCFSHNDCCEHKRLEVRLGDCALMDQENERVSRKRAPEVCSGRRLESLTLCEFSRSCAGLIYCGGESGLVFLVPSTL
uniref:Rab-GAP TBC domain-containing protein n=1 Tax=Globodera pallida TaxID=36090 RepID=A0A183CI10_GLOPA